MTGWVERRGQEMSDNMSFADFVCVWRQSKTQVYPEKTEEKDQIERKCKKRLYGEFSLTLRNPWSYPKHGYAG